MNEACSLTIDGGISGGIPISPDGGVGGGDAGTSVSYACSTRGTDRPEHRSPRVCLEAQAASGAEACNIICNHPDVRPPNTRDVTSTAFVAEYGYGHCGSGDSARDFLYSDAPAQGTRLGFVVPHYSTVEVEVVGVGSATVQPVETSVALVGATCESGDCDGVIGDFELLVPEVTLTDGAGATYTIQDLHITQVGASGTMGWPINVLPTLDEWQPESSTCDGEDGTPEVCRAGVNVSAGRIIAPEVTVPETPGGARPGYRALNTTIEGAYEILDPSAVPRWMTFTGQAEGSFDVSGTSYVARLTFDVFVEFRAGVPLPALVGYERPVASSTMMMSSFASPELESMDAMSFEGAESMSITAEPENELVLDAGGSFADFGSGIARYEWLYAPPGMPLGVLAYGKEVIVAPLHWAAMKELGGQICVRVQNYAEYHDMRCIAVSDVEKDEDVPIEQDCTERLSTFPYAYDFHALLAASGVDLSEYPQSTILAVSDAYFAEKEPNLVEYLLKDANEDELNTFIKDHIVTNGAFAAWDLGKQDEVILASGRQSILSPSMLADLLVLRDIGCAPGMLHVVHGIVAAD